MLMFVTCPASIDWICFFIGSGSIDIPVLCMLVSGDASMLEVKAVLYIFIGCSRLFIALEELTDFV